nr:hypothetical protein [Bacteroidota bacterium]
MKKSVLTFGAVVALLCCLFVDVAYAQVETQLIYKERGRNQVDVQIYFSDQNGS